METCFPFARRGRAASASALAAAVLVLSLTGCGDDTAGDDQAAPSDSPTPSAASSPSEEPTSEPAGDTEPASDDAADDDGGTPGGVGTKDEMERFEFPGADVVFADSGSASSDGKTFTVTTPAEETISIDLPTEAEGWIYDATIDLGDAGTGYMVTQAGGDSSTTFLVVLDDGEPYYPQPDADVIFGQFSGEGPFFETYTTDDGVHLVTHLKDAPSGATEEYYEWTIKDRKMVPTLLS
jgi:hypothetical protein